MMSERQRQITRTKRIGWLIEALAFLGFYAPFLILWVYLLRPTGPSITVSLGVGICAIAVLITPWNQNQAKLKRLEKYATLFDPFFEAMIEDMERNDPEKGDSWLTIDFGELLKLMKKKQELVIEEFGPATPTTYLDQELAKLGNYCAMVFMRVYGDIVE